MTINGDPIKDYVYLNGVLTGMVDASASELVDVSVALKGNNGQYNKEAKTITYQVIVANAGPAQAANVRLVQTLPADVTLTSLVTAQGQCQVATSSCQLGTLAAGQSVIIDVVVSTGNDKKMDFVATVTTDSIDGDAKNNTVTRKFGGALGWWLLATLAMLGMLRRQGSLNMLSRKVWPVLAFGVMGAGYAPSSQAEVFYVLTDHLGTPKVITNSANTTVWQATYHPFGQVDVTVALIENNVRFLGQYFDRETGLHYNYFRDYDPKVGRYVQSDPIGLRGGLNTYVYGLNNPLMYIDPTGEAPILLNLGLFTLFSYSLYNLLPAVDGAYSYNEAFINRNYDFSDSAQAEAALQAQREILNHAACYKLYLILYRYA